MQLSLPGAPHLTYCTNIHAGERWQDIDAKLRTHLPAIKQRVSPDSAMGVGLRLSSAAADDLADPQALARLQAFLRAGDFYVFTVNAFPYGSFHGTRVKEQVYEPDWRDARRLRFTDRVADLPRPASARRYGGQHQHRTWRLQGTRSANRPMLARMAELLVRHAAHLHAIAGTTGKQIVLALEPDPAVSRNHR